MKYASILLFALISAGSWSQETTAPPPPVPDSLPIQFRVEEQAQFPGGMPAMRKYLAENMVYPPTAVTQGIEGKCYVKIKITEEGKLKDPLVLKGVPDCPECDAEALRLVLAMPDWIPYKDSHGKARASFYNLPIVFKLQ